MDLRKLQIKGLPQKKVHPVQTQWDARIAQTLVDMRKDEKWDEFFTLSTKWLTSQDKNFTGRWPVSAAELPDILATAMANELSHLMVMAAQVEDDPTTVAERAYAEEQYRTLDIDLRTQYHMLWSLMAGYSPVIELSRAQQIAILNSAPPEEVEVEEWPFPFGCFVMLAEPFAFLPFYIEDATTIELLGLFFPHAPTVMAHGQAMWATALYRYDNNYVLMPQTDISYTIDDDETKRYDQRTIRGYTAMLELCQTVFGIISMFGLTEDRPETMRVPREERRRRERFQADAEKKAKQRSPVAVRYLKDHNALKVTTTYNKSGRHISPHMRKGHVRMVPHGPLHVEERPKRRVYVGPVLVNGHLVDLDQMVIYRTKEAK